MQWIMNFMRSDDLATIASLFFQKANDYFTQKTHDYLAIIRKKMLRLLLCDYQRTARCYTIYRTFKSWSSDDFTTIPRLSAGRSYDYSNWNAATIADLYWLSSDSPKREAAASRQWFRPPAAPLLLDYPAGSVLLTACQHLPAIRRRWEQTPPGWHGL